jgi:hypothetical protein
MSSSRYVSCLVGLVKVAIESWWIAGSVESWRSPAAGRCWVARLSISQVGETVAEVDSAWLRVWR